MSTVKDESRGRFTAESDLYGFARNKFRLGSGDGFARARLRQFVGSDFLLVFAGNVRHYKKFGKSFDERGFTDSDGTDDSDVNIAARSFADIVINVVFFHKNSLQ